MIQKVVASDPSCTDWLLEAASPLATFDKLGDSKGRKPLDLFLAAALTTSIRDAALARVLQRKSEQLRRTQKAVQPSHLWLETVLVTS